MTTEKVLKASVESIVVMDTAMFADQDLVGQLNLLCEADMEVLQQKINEYQNDPRSRSGGGYLLTELNYIYDAKAALTKHLNNVREALIPKAVKVRTTVKQTEGKVQDKNITAVADTLKGLSDKVLRTMAETVLVEHADDYTSDELPYALAYKQITGEYWQQSV